MSLDSKKLKLPKTDFPMKAGLPELEKRIIKFWEENEIRTKIKARRKDCQPFVLFFGPPYANGPLHIGHSVPTLLKDLILRSRNLLNYDINNLIGFDCHGLPIELAVKKTFTKPPQTLKEFLDACNAFAKKYIDIQESTIIRMGMLKESGYYSTYESISEIYKVFSNLLLKNLVYLDRKPCPWSITEKTVVSDAEISYRTKISKTVDVALEIMESTIENFIGKFICIWTTTPWTLVDNVAVAFNKNYQYLLCEVGEKILIIGEKVAEAFQERTNIKLNILGIISGAVFEGMTCRHPILDKSVPLLHSDHVEEDSGTGFVHIAPAHGLEDFELCQKHDIDLIESVDDAGFFYENVYKLGGKHIFAHQEDIFDALEGKLLCVSTIEHEYPYDSRGGDIEIDGEVIFKGTPLIYRATEQIFIDIHQMDLKNLEKDIYNLKTRPDNLKKTIFETVTKRKEWCVSRNRALGVPSALFVEKGSGDLLINKDLQTRIIMKIREDPSYFLKDSCIEILKDFVDDIHSYTPKIFVLDVWFDSGCAWSFIPHQYFGNHEHICDLIIEGKDQVRGWFQSLLLTSYLHENKLPYRAIVSHGFVVDEKGNKMSKSKGNVVDLNDTMEQFGSEILRIWLITSDYTDDISIGPNILNKCSEIYRKIRNVMRYLISIAESNEIQPTFDNFHYLEKAMFNEFNEMKKNYLKFLTDFQLRHAFDEIFMFIHRISELYFNARKDTIYCDAENSQERLSAVMCMTMLLYYLTILLSPILPMTTDEIFTYCNGFYMKEKLQSVHELSIEDLNIQSFDDVEIKSLEPIMLEARKLIEEAKQNGKITKNTDIILYINSEIIQPLDVLAKLLGIHEVKIGTTFKIEILNHPLCNRCAKRIINHDDNETCLRCLDVLSYENIS